VAEWRIPSSQTVELVTESRPGAPWKPLTGPAALGSRRPVKRQEMRSIVVATVRAYLDTSILSALAKGDGRSEDLIAIAELFSSHTQGEIELVCSEVVDAELARIPVDFRGPHLAQLAHFRSIPRVTVGGLTRMTAAGFPGASPRFLEFQRLKRILRDDEDRWHVFVASRNRIKYLVTVDARTMLSKTDAVLAATGVQLVRPAQLLQVIRGGNAAA